MYQFFISPDNIHVEDAIITGQDVNHIKNVLRFEVEDELQLCDNTGKLYHCRIASLTNDEIRCKIQSVEVSRSELPVKITLFQGAPKQDKMEMIIQKCVELGVNDIRPVSMKRTIVKYDQKKMKKKQERWQNISESAAKQSKRAIIPEIGSLLTFKELLTKLPSYDKVIIPYENAAGMEGTRELIGSIEKGAKVAIVIGPEGGIDDEEILRLEEAHGETMTLGNRILRTETAGMTCLAMIGYHIEEA